MAPGEKRKQHSRDEQQQALLFAAAIAALMACLERAVVGVWAFLALNVLLLAIALTFKSPIPKFVEGKKMKKIMVSGSGSEVDLKLKDDDGDDGEGGEWEDDGIEVEEEDQISKEELNRRAEDFIATFRRHLVSDCAKARN